jgi:transposase
MTVYIGVDFHARQQTISYLTTEEGEIRQQELDHGEPVKMRKFYEQFAGQPVVVGFESSGYAVWFEELLEELGYEIWIGHATAIRSFARRRQKNDRRDADLILELLVDGDFPRIHRYSPESRAVLQELRYRQRLVKMRTMVMNSLLYMATSRGVTLRGQLRSKRGLGAVAANPIARDAGRPTRGVLPTLAGAISQDRQSGEFPGGEGRV